MPVHRHKPTLLDRLQPQGQESQGICPKLTLLDRIHPNKVWRRDASTTSRTTDALGSPKSKPTSFSSRLSPLSYPTHPPKSPLLLDHTSPCLIKSRVNSRELKRDQPGNTESARSNQRLNMKVPLIQRIGVEKAVTSQENLLVNVPNSTTPPLLSRLKPDSSNLSLRVLNVPMRSLPTGREIRRKSDGTSCTINMDLNSMNPDGPKSSLVNVSTSTLSTPSFPLPEQLTSRPQHLSGMSKSAVERRRQLPRKLPQTLTGSRLGTKQLKPLNSHSLIERLSSTDTSPTSPCTSLNPIPLPTTGLSASIKPSEAESALHAGLNSPTTMNSKILCSHISTQMEDSDTITEIQSPAIAQRIPVHPTNVIPVANGTAANAHVVHPHAAMHISAPLSKTDVSVGANTLKRSISKTLSPNQTESELKRPRYRRGLIWSPLDISFSPTARSTEYAEPVPNFPEPLLDSDSARTVARRPELFKIVTPINVDRFQALLADHPNQLFVDSVCRALREGFWPWADVPGDSYPSINDNSMHTCKKSDVQLAFIEEQLQEEIRLG